MVSMTTSIQHTKCEVQTNTPLTAYM